jgi:ribosome-binding protein aMBF1 (putative translation factor)
LGIAQRTIHIKFSQRQAQHNRFNQLQSNHLTIGDWIKVKRTEKNITSGHVAAKMGIPHAVVRSWEAGECRADCHQLNDLAKILGIDAQDFKAHLAGAKIMPYSALKSQP